MDHVLHILMLNNVKSMLLMLLVDGMELFVLISHAQLLLQKKIQMLYAQLINQVVQLIKPELDVWHYLLHVKDIKLKEIVNTIWLVLNVIGILLQIHVLLEPVIMPQIPQHQIQIVTLI